MAPQNVHQLYRMYDRKGLKIPWESEDVILSRNNTTVTTVRYVMLYIVLYMTIDTNYTNIYKYLTNVGEKNN